MIHYTILYDYYGDLLTDKQKIYFEDYYFNNLSLQEISENYGVSRNAIHKSLNDITNKLDYYESVMKLHEKGLKIEKLIDKLDSKLKEQIKELI